MTRVIKENCVRVRNKSAECGFPFELLAEKQPIITVCADRIDIGLLAKFMIGSYKL